MVIMVIICQQPDSILVQQVVQSDQHWPTVARLGNDLLARQCFVLHTGLLFSV